MSVVVPPDSPWFSGHFPHMPVLPGIAQLGMVLEAIERSTGLALAVSRLFRVRFRRMIVPGKGFEITVSPRSQKDPFTYSFRLQDGDGLILSGIMVVKQRL